MFTKILSFITGLSVLITGVGFVPAVYAESPTNEKTRVEIVREKHDAYESARRALAKSPRSLIARKQVLTSYVDVIDLRLAHIEQEVRKLASSATTTEAYLSFVSADRATLADVREKIDAAKTLQDISAITARIKALNIFLDTTTSRVRVLGAHRDVLITQGITVLESRIAQIKQAIAILEDDGKNVVELKSLLVTTEERIASAKMRMSELSFDAVKSDEAFELTRNELIAIEGEIRGAFVELDALSEKGKAIRDAE